MKFSESEKKLIELALSKAERDGEFSISSIRLDGTLRKGGAKAYLTVEADPPAPEKSSSFGCWVAALFWGFVLFCIFAGAVGSQHTKAEPQQDQATVEATPTPGAEAEATPTPGN